MKKVIVLLIVVLMSGVVYGQDDDQRIRKTSANMNFRERKIVNKAIDHVYVLDDSITAYAEDFSTGDLYLKGRVVQAYDTLVDFDDYPIAGDARRYYNLLSDSLTVKPVSSGNNYFH